MSQQQDKKMSVTNTALNQRLDRVESKIDQLAEVLVTIARNEEILKNLKENLDDEVSARKKLEEKVDTLQGTVDGNQRTVSIINAISWVAVTTAVIAIIRFFTTMGLT